MLTKVKDFFNSVWGMATIVALVFFFCLSLAFAHTMFPLENMRASSVTVSSRTIESYGDGASGVIVSPTTILTAAHVVRNRAAPRPTGEAWVETVYVQFDDGEVREGRVIYYDPFADVAVVYIPVPDKYAPAELACRTPVVGEEVASIGNPMAANRALSIGYVSSLDDSDHPFWREQYAILDISGSYGSSGAPIFDAEGRVLGLIVGGIMGPAGQTGFLTMTKAEAWCDKVKF